MELINKAIEHKDDIALIITSIISLAAAIASVTPSETDNVVLNKIVKLINALGLNVGKAKRAPVIKDEIK